MIQLGVNIDHVATVREARGEDEPCVLEAARVVEKAGADGITIHLREDRRHIQDADVRALRKQIKTRLNLEMALSEEIIGIALVVRPEQVTLVPEKREELTTEGGLDVVGERKKIEKACKRFNAAGIAVSLFINPTKKHIACASSIGVNAIELHTGRYAHEYKKKGKGVQYDKLVGAADYAHNCGLIVNAGHGLNYDNLADICQLPYLAELNIGHSIISRALFCGLPQAVREMKQIISKATLCHRKRSNKK